MTDDVKVVIRHIRVAANEWVRVYGNMEYPPNLKLAIMAADALEAATVAPAVDREALAERLFYIDGRDDWGVANEDEREEYLERASMVMAVCEARDVRDVQAETLEEAADDIEPLGYGGTVTGILRMRAQAIREARND